MLRLIKQMRDIIVVKHMEKQKINSNMSRFFIYVKEEREKEVHGKKCEFKCCKYSEAG